MRHIDEIQIAGTAILLCGAMFAVSAVAPTGNTVSKAVTNFTEAPETAAEAQAQAEAQAEEDGFTIYTQESNYDSDYDNSYNDTSYNDSSYNTDTTQDGSLDDTGQENDNTDTGDGSSDDGSSDQTSSDDTGDDSSDQIDYPSDDNSGDSTDGSLDNSDTWEEFIERYTENKHIVNSKYIRQVILGNCNPKRQVTYEKYLMGLVLEVLIDELGYSTSDIAFYSNDEIVIDMGKYKGCINKQKILEMAVNVRFNIPFRIELFYLHKITGTDGYYKEIVKNIIEREYEFKCLNNYTLPFVLRKFNGEEITENDKVFYHEGLLSKFMEVPNMEVKLNENKYSV